MNRRKAIIAAVVVTGLLMVIALKLLFFPSVKDAYFAVNYRSLQQVPAGMVVLRPTHYSFLKHVDPMYAPSPHSRTNFWIVGRNAPLRDVIGMAYDENPSRVMLPIDAPKGNFDFLVTVNQKSRERLQAAIQRKFGFRAQKEMREAEVLALKVINPASPGLRVSDDGEKQGARLDVVTVHFVKAPVEGVLRVLNQFYRLSVVNKTGLTNSYDYSLVLPLSAQARLRDEAAMRVSAGAMIKDLGLGLEPELEPSEVLVVKTRAAVPPMLPDKKWRLLGPLNPGAEEGCEYWYHGMDGKGELLTDNTDPASGENDFTIENTSTDRHDHADWRCETFSLGTATNGTRPIRFSFDYKLPGPVKNGDNLRVQLRFYDQDKKFMEQKEFWVGTRSHDSVMTSYKTITSEDILPPSGARTADVTMTANLYDGDQWSSGIARFDNIFVTIQ